jgi:TonB-linked SusC/RagA family outer membrane protein
MILTSVAFAQEKKVSGRVTGADGKPLAGVTIVVQGSTTATQTDSNGNYSLSVPTGKVIVFRSVGYSESTLIVREGQSTFNVILDSSDKTLEEVLIVAYGKQDKRTFTGSAGVIGSESIQKESLSNISRALEGKIPGVNIDVGSGQPGAGSAVRIRGFGSINASNSPLYVVDGVPFVSTTENTNSENTNANPLNMINPADIESVTVLKDAASSALYGARAANGVILITTKSGKKGRTNFEFSAKGGINSRAVPEYDVFENPADFYKVAWQSIKHGAMFRATNPLSEADAGKFASDNLISRLGGYNNYNVDPKKLVDPITGLIDPNAKLLYQDIWKDEAFRNGARQEYNFSASGATEATNYLFSAGYLNDEGYVPSSDFSRASIRLKIDQKVNDWLKVGGNVAYSDAKQENTNSSSGSYQNMFMFTRRIAPIFPVYLRDKDGNFIYDPAKGNRLYDFGDSDPNGLIGKRTFASNENPIATLELDDYSSRNNNFTGRTYAEIKFLKDFTFTASYSLDQWNLNSTGFQNPTYGNSAGIGGRGTKYTVGRRTENFNQLLNYKKNLNDAHDFNILLGHEAYSFTSSVLTGQKTNYVLPNNPELDNGVVIQYLSSYKDTYKVDGYFGQAQYSYLKRYNFSASLRRDASSRFHPDNRWGTFWSLGGAWQIAEESFVKNWTDKINDLKLRVSYGETGNDNLGTDRYYYYAYMDQFGVTNNNDDIALGLVYKGNRDITWETKKDLSIGLDFGLFNNRLTGSFDYYDTRRNNQLFLLPQATSTGIQRIPFNVGDVQNKGIEIVLGGDIIRNENLRWNLTLNGTHFTNKILRLPEQFRKDGIVDGTKKLLEGHSIYEFFTYNFAGVDSETGAALYTMDVKDQNGNITGTKTTTIASDGTRYMTGKSSIPDFQGGINSSLEYKGFDFSFQATYSLGGYVYDSNYAALMGSGGGDWNNWHKDILNSWSTTNKNSSIPAVMENNQNVAAQSDRFLIDASYLSLRNVTLGYKLPNNTLNTLGLRNARVYFSGDNLLLISKRKGFDPRQGFAGIVSNAYAPIRTISLGLNVNF